MSVTPIRENLRRLLNPRHIAFVGGRGLGASIAVSRSLGFKGQVWVVNPTYNEIAGLKCYEDVSQLPEPPDAVYLAVPRESVVDIVRKLASRGAGGAVCFASGFAEIGGVGVEIQKRLIESAGDLALMGPNCTGFINYLDGVAAITGPQGGVPVRTGAAVLAQSGTITLNSGMSDRSLDLSHVISVGNEAVLQVADFVQVLVEDERVRAIGVALETIRDVDSFAAAAAAARARRVPIIALKTGRSELGAQSALSHTGALAGADQIYNDYFERLGVVRVETLPVFLETLKYLTTAGRVEGRRTLILTCSGFEAGLAADAAERAGLELPAFSEGQEQDLKRQLPPFAKVANPLDYHMAIWGNRQAQEQCFRASIGPDFDSAVVIANYPRSGARDLTDWTALVDALIDAHKSETIPLAFMSSLTEGVPVDVRCRLKSHGIAPIQGMDDGLLAVAAVARVTELWQMADGVAPLIFLRSSGVEPSSPGPMVLNEWMGKQLLGAFGVRVPRGKVLNREELLSWSHNLSFPVVIKALSEHLPHKSEAGGIEIGVESDADISQVVERLNQRVRSRTGIELTNYLVEEMVAAPVAEIIVGVRRQPPFGLSLLLGAGGVLAELTRDTQEMILPVSATQIHGALGKLKVAKLLHGFRGQPEGDIDALVDCILAVAEFAGHLRDSLLELDINPVMVLPKGQGVVAVDALIVLDKLAQSVLDEAGAPIGFGSEEQKKPASRSKKV